MVGYVAIVSEKVCNQAYFYADKQNVFRDYYESQIVAVEEVSSTKDVYEVLDKNGFDDEYVGFFLQEDIPYQYILSWKE